MVEKFSSKKIVSSFSKTHFPKLVFLTKRVVKATGFNYSAMTCHGCKTFFRRYVARGDPLHCPREGRCDVTKGFPDEKLLFEPDLLCYSTRRKKAQFSDENLAQKYFGGWELNSPPSITKRWSCQWAVNACAHPCNPHFNSFLSGNIEDFRWFKFFFFSYFREAEQLQVVQVQQMSICLNEPCQLASHQIWSLRETINERKLYVC